MKIFLAFVLGMWLMESIHIAYAANDAGTTHHMQESRLLVECLPAEPRKHDFVYFAQLPTGEKLQCWPEGKK